MNNRGVFSINRWQAFLLINVVLVWGLGSATAANYCVESSEELQSALDMAETNGEADTIKIRSGEYFVPGESFEYDSTGTPGGDQMGLTVSGGWVDFWLGYCNSRGFGQTTLSGAGQHRIMRIATSGSSTLTVEHIRFVAGRADDDRGGALWIGGDDFDGEVVIENNEFLLNQARFSSALNIAGGITSRVIGNLFAANNALVSSVFAAVSDGANGIYFINNTVTANAAQDLSKSGGVSISASGSSQALIANNILWGNQTSDLSLGGGTVHLNNNDIQVMEGDATTAQDNLSVDPQFEDGNELFELAEFSPLRDAGLNPPTFAPFPIPFDFAWSLPEKDFSNGFRIENDRVDIGAIEGFSARTIEIFSNSFEDG